jgi:hypothetical protein
MAITTVWESATQRMESCDHENTTEPLEGASSVSCCTACGHTWPRKFGPGVPKVSIIDTTAETGSD